MRNEFDVPFALLRISRGPFWQWPDRCL